MTGNPLRILSSRESAAALSPRERQQAQWEAFWQKNRDDSTASAWEEERFFRTLELLKKHSEIRGKRCVDLGAGAGIFTRMLTENGAFVTALDISQTALELCQNGCTTNIEIIRDSLPKTRLADSSFDLVVCLDLIADLEERDYRLCVSEWARLIQGAGCLICSTPLDTASEDALERFVALVQTEFVIIDATVSYRPLFNWKKLKSLRALKLLESLTRTLYQERGIDHVILLGQRRPL